MQAESRDCTKHIIGDGDTAEHLDITLCSRLGYETDPSLGFDKSFGETPKAADEKPVKRSAYTVFVSISRAKNALWTRELPDRDASCMLMPVHCVRESNCEEHTDGPIHQHFAASDLRCVHCCV